MPSAINLSGKRFGTLSVIKTVFNWRWHDHRRWLCKCDCGKELTTTAYELRSGRTKSCGCQRAVRGVTLGRSKRHAPGSAMFRQVVRSYKERASRKGITYSLTDAQAKVLMEACCHYCGKEPAQIKKPGNGCWGRFVYNGVDRLDSTAGYEIMNCVPCCKDCNYAKRSRTESEFIAWAKRIAERHSENK